jgi:hypothetical protein
MTVFAYYLAIIPHPASYKVGFTPMIRKDAVPGGRAMHSSLLLVVLKILSALKELDSVQCLSRWVNGWAVPVRSSVA